jgi:antitoxin MazE
MQLNIIQIGNSKGIRLSKAIMEQYKLHDKVELTLEKDRIIITPVKEPRKGWAEAFARMHANGHDELLIDDVFQEEEWD